MEIIPILNAGSYFIVHKCSHVNISFNGFQTNTCTFLPSTCQTVALLIEKYSYVNDKKDVRFGVSDQVQRKPTQTDLCTNRRKLESSSEFFSLLIKKQVEEELYYPSVQ